MAQEHGFEDVKLWPIQQERNVPPIIPGQGRAPALLADVIVPVVLVGDGKGNGASSNEISAYSFIVGAQIFGANAVGVPYCEFAAPKQPPSQLTAAILSGLAKFIDTALPLPLFQATLSPGTTNLRSDRAVIIDDVSFTVSAVTGGEPAMSVAIHTTTIGNFRAISNSFRPNPGTTGTRPFASASRLDCGHLPNGVPSSSPTTAGYFESAGMIFNYVNGQGGAGTIHPFEGATPFLLSQDQIITIGQTDFSLGVPVGSDNNFAVSIRYREIPLT